jgi:hypothetical protein
MNALLKIFREASGLNAHHVAVNYPSLSLEFNGRDAGGKEFHFVTGPTDGNLEKHAKIAGTFQKYRILDKIEEELTPMANVTGLSQFAQSIKSRLAELHGRVAEAQGELNTVLSEAEQAAQRAEAMVSDAKAEVAEVIAALGGTTNQ